MVDSLLKKRNKRKITPRALAKLREAIFAGARIKEACEYAGVSLDTYYRLARNDPKMRLF
jgi:hypothetical protein